MDDFKQFWYWVRESPPRTFRMTLLVATILVGICVLSASVLVPLLVMR